ncbi:SIR2 family protein [Frigoriflavimonas asaccharolytica]|uniref:Putative Rossmann-fold nucleotide-binding protein n=1 Tax=Frigoriflavimonas asaccharolytica TaxID=2735899 RepID=A0A8J8GCL7_9FLAO|nr:SIR2 family protein [Frigoriflavimonas asaccharolytica]NRS93764.1 putative Rossmann-fold nucleotide-binding protein [Frigoriflavimonas asaccharolytica]
MTQDEFTDVFSHSLYNNKGVYFIGSGISVPSGLPDWKGLIEKFVKEIGIDKVEDTDDLPSLAQYYVNKKSKKDLYGAINDDFSNKKPNHYHDIFKITNIKTIWTTNYDDLLEKTFRNNYELKISDKEVFTFVEAKDKIEIIKIHGSIKRNIKDIVITQSDYEDFFIRKPTIVQRLKVDLLQNSFVFMGYNYGDPNIQNILTEVRRLKSDKNKIKHYILLKDKSDQKFKLWCNNLERYNIFPVLYKDHDDFSTLLKKIALKSRGNSVFITGSHTHEKIDDLKLLIKYIVKGNLILIDGQSQGIMRTVVSKFTTRCIKKKIDYQNRIKYFPNPYAANSKFANDSSLLPQLKNFRKPLMKASQVVVAFDGGMGTCAEIKVAQEMGCVVIPFFKNKKSKTWKLIDKIDSLDSAYDMKLKAGKIEMLDLINILNKQF